MDDKMKKDIEAVVASIFSEKEEADARRRTEDALGESAKVIEELTTTLEEKNTEVSTITEKLAGSEKLALTLKSELEAAKVELEVTKDKAAKAEKTVEDMLMDKKATERMSDLESAGVVRSDKESQRAKVLTMSDEEFSAYKDELISIRASVLAELDEAKKLHEAEEAKKLDDAEAKAKAEAEAKAKGSVATAPADIDTGKALAAAMNLEISPSDDLIKKYGDLGKAMAAVFKQENEEV